MIIFTAFLIATLIGGVVWILTNFVWAGVATWVWLFGAFLLQGLRKISADPPNKAVLTIWGERKHIVKNEGWRFFPLYPWLHGFIQVKVTKVDQDLPEEVVRTPDLAGLSVSVSITCTPDSEIDGESHELPLIEFLNSGGERGVKNILADIMRERLREWAISTKEGPQTSNDA